MTPNLGNLPIDLTRLLESRMLIQSNSGGGKSHALRRVLEQTAPGVQQIVIDPEGEFSSLREKFDYLICAPSGADAVATPATAAALARAIWESGVSAIVDIYELKAHDRIQFVALFCDALINAPKKIWHPTLLAIDEAHIFAPQVGQALSLGPVSDIATRGRKRGLSLLAATQRLAKLHKDVAAELLNKLIGRTGLDVDVRRAGEELGLTPREAMEQLRPLDPGDFFVYGPALSRAVTKTRIGPVVTTHPQPGHRMMAPPPPASPKLLKKLSELEGLQREAFDEVRTVESLKIELQKVRKELATSQKQVASGGVPEAEVSRRIAQAVAAVPKGNAPLAGKKALIAAVEKIAAGLQIIQAELAGVDVEVVPRARTVVREQAAPAAKSAPPSGAPEQRILDSIAWWCDAGIEHPSRHQVAFVANYTVNGHFNNLAGTLRGKGLIVYPSGGALCLTEQGWTVAKAPTSKPTRADLVERVTAVLKSEPLRRIFAVLVNANRPMGRRDLAEAAGYTENGHFNNIVGSLNGIGVIEYPTKGFVGLSSIFKDMQ